MVTSVATGLTTQQTQETAKKVSDAGLSQLAEDFSSFLTLFTTQLKNQDPTDPQDASEFTNQIVAFTEVEQSINTNKKLDDLIELSSKGNYDPVSYIGKSVETVGNVTQLYNGSTDISFTVEEAVRQGEIFVYNEKGALVYKKAFDDPAWYGPGVHRFTWDGKGTDGNQQPDGMYSVTVSILDSNGSPKELSTTVSGIIDGVYMESEEPVLLIGKYGVPMSSITSIKATKPAVTS